MATTERPATGGEAAAQADAIRRLEERLADHDADLRTTREELDRVREELDSLRSMIRELAAKTTAVCKKCGISYDVFAHHYSIGLFDNIVYVKCPDCQTPMPVDPRHGVRAE